MELSTWPPNYASLDNITRAACASSDCMVSLASFVMQTHNHPLSKKMVHLTHQHGREVLLVKDNRHERYFLLDSRGHFMWRSNTHGDRYLMRWKPKWANCPCRLST